MPSHIFATLELELTLLLGSMIRISGPVWLEVWITCLIKSIAWKLPEILIKSASPGKLRDSPFGWKHVPEKFNKKRKYVFFCL